jgi:tRNA-specific 2-thiouridylase
VTAGPAEELLSNEFTVAGVNWIALDDPTEAVRAEVRVRYRHTCAAATITPLENQRARIVFDEPQRAITPGQGSVFYRGDEVIGGGWIVRSSRQ